MHSRFVALSLACGFSVCCAAFAEKAKHEPRDATLAELATRAASVESYGQPRHSLPATAFYALQSIKTWSQRHCGPQGTSCSHDEFAILAAALTTIRERLDAVNCTDAVLLDPKKYRNGIAETLDYVLAGYARSLRDGTLEEAFGLLQELPLSSKLERRKQGPRLLEQPSAWYRGVCQDVASHHICPFLDARSLAQFLHVESMLRQAGQASREKHARAGLDKRVAQFCERPPIFTKAKSRRTLLAMAAVAKQVDQSNRRSGQTALMKAAAKGDLELVRGLLALGADPKVVSHTGGTAMAYAYASRNLAVIKTLARASGNIAAYITFKGQPLSKRGLAFVRELLENGASPDDRFKGMTPLLLACQRSDLELVRLLLEFKADTRATNPQQRTALAELSLRNVTPPESLSMVKLLAEPAGDLAHLVDAIIFGVRRRFNEDELAMARRILEAGADPNAHGQQGRRPLWGAVYRADLPLMRLLLEFGADAMLIGDPKSGMRIINGAYSFLEQGKDPELRLQSCRELSLAAKELVRYASYIARRSTRPLEAEDLDFIASLAKAGAPITSFHPALNKTAMQIATKTGHPELAELLQELLVEHGPKETEANTAL